MTLTLSIIAIKELDELLLATLSPFFLLNLEDLVTVEELIAD